MWSLLASHLIVKKRPNRVGNARRRRSSTITSGVPLVEPIATEGRPDFSNYGLIANKIMQKMGYDLENPVGLKNGKGLDEGTKEYIKRRGGYPLSDVRPGVHPKLCSSKLRSSPNLLIELR
ncbi:hypothetical protein V6N13_016175 [Hibiscus sabdariffa]